jgi:hypothetical protein
MLVQKMDEEDGVALGSVNDIKESNRPLTPLIPDAFIKGAEAARELAKDENKQNFELAKEENKQSFELNKMHLENKHELDKLNPKKENNPLKVVAGKEIDEDGDGVMDGIDLDGDGTIDLYFAHRQCEHVWGDADGDGDLECLKCGKIKDLE